MATITVKDIQVCKDNTLHSLKGQKIYKNGAWHSFAAGSGIFKGGNWYVLPPDSSQMDIFNKYCKDRYLTDNFFPIVNKIGSAVSSESSKYLFFYRNPTGLFSVMDTEMKIIPLLNLIPNATMSEPVTYAAQKPEGETNPSVPEGGGTELPPPPPPGPETTDPASNPELYGIYEWDKIVIGKSNMGYYIVRFSPMTTELVVAEFNNAWQLTDTQSIILVEDFNDMAIVKGDITIIGGIIYVSYFMGGNVYVNRVVKNLGGIINQDIYKVFRLDQAGVENGAIVFDDVYNKDKTIDKIELLFYYITSQKDTDGQTRPLRAYRAKFTDRTITRISIDTPNATLAQDAVIAPVCYSHSGFWVLHYQSQYCLQHFTLSPDRLTASLARTINTGTGDFFHFAQDLSMEDPENIWSSVLNQGYFIRRDI